MIRFKRRNYSGIAAALLAVDDREGRVDVHVARGNDVGLAEVDDDVAVGVRVRLMEQLHRLAVEVEGILRHEERVGRPPCRRHTVGPFRLHAHLRLLVREDLGGVRGAGPACAAKLPEMIDFPAFGDLHVAARVIAMGVGVDDVANRLVAGEPTDFRRESPRPDPRFRYPRAARPGRRSGPRRSRSRH